MDRRDTTHEACRDPPYAVTRHNIPRQSGTDRIMRFRSIGPREIGV